jgi:hypothetical protein
MLLRWRCGRAAVAVVVAGAVEAAVKGEVGVVGREAEAEAEVEGEEKVGVEAGAVRGRAVVRAMREAGLRALGTLLARDEATTHPVMSEGRVQGMYRGTSVMWI